MIDFSLFITALVAYFIGAIPTGYIVARLKGVNDIRQHGSGNIGATNVSRLLGLHYFFLIFLLDAGKAYFFISFIAPLFPLHYLYLCAGLVLLGNTRSIFLHGSGGKGVATVFGLLAALNLAAVAVILIMWSVSMLCIKTVGIASVFAVASLPLYAVIYQDCYFVIFSFSVAVWVAWLHRSNIQTYYKQWHVQK